MVNKEDMNKVKIEHNKNLVLLLLQVRPMNMDELLSYVNAFNNLYENLFFTSDQEYLKEFVTRVKPLLNTVTSQETLQVIADRFIEEKKSNG